MKPTELEMERALDIVRDLIPYGLHEAIKGEEDNKEFFEEAKDYANKNGISFFCGASKLVIVDEESDWVIKLSFDCSVDVDEGMESDYCKRELYNYEKACEEGVEKFFAEICMVGEVDGIEVYLQEKLKVDDGVEKDVDQIFRDYVYSLDESYYDDIEDEDERNAILTDDVYEMDEEERIEAIFGFDERLITFIENNDINDLHSGNFGYRGADLVIMDYSGWNVYSIEERDKDNEEDE